MGARSHGLPPVVLASASPRRAQLLRECLPEFRVVAGAIPEIHNEQLTASEAALINSCRKARHVAARHPDALVLGADTLVSLGTRLFGKPADLLEARGMLRELSGQTHQVVTAICLVQASARRERRLVEATEVTFRELDDDLITRYLGGMDPLDKAGAYAIQEHGELIVERISGSFTNVVGLPVERLREELARWEMACA